jgi:hypothetical protein
LAARDAAARKAAWSLNSVTTHAPAPCRAHGRRSDLQLGAHHQRVRELALHAHAVRRDGAAVRGDEVHQAEAEGLHARMRGDVEGAVHRGGRLDQPCSGKLLRAGGIERAAARSTSAAIPPWAA